MCDFKDKYGDYFNKAHSFMEQFHGISSNEEWATLSAAISGLKPIAKFDVNLVVAVVNEIERAYHEGVPKPQCDFNTVYRPVFERVYRFARRLFFYAQSPSCEKWNSFITKIESIKNPTKFERSLLEICFREFFADNVC